MQSSSKMLLFSGHQSPVRTPIYLDLLVWNQLAITPQSQYSIKADQSLPSFPARRSSESELLHASPGENPPSFGLWHASYPRSVRIRLILAELSPAVTSCRTLQHSTCCNTQDYGPKKQALDSPMEFQTHVSLLCVSQNPRNPGEQNRALDITLGLREPPTRKTKDRKWSAEQ